jgi:hypothetical protein
MHFQPPPEAKHVLVVTHGGFIKEMQNFLAPEGYIILALCKKGK